MFLSDVRDSDLLIRCLQMRQMPGRREPFSKSWDLVLLQENVEWIDVLFKESFVVFFMFYKTLVNNTYDKNKREEHIFCWK